MIDQLIRETALEISYTPAEIDNIASTTRNLKAYLNQNPLFQDPFLGGSYTRGRMVKGISDVDVYIRYMGTSGSSTALGELKRHLQAYYRDNLVQKDKPSVSIEFNRIKMDVTPYKEDLPGIKRIPEKQSVYWREVQFGSLEESVKKLRQNSPLFIDLIKVLKFWNEKKGKGLDNFDLEQKVCNFILNSGEGVNTLSGWMMKFLQGNVFTGDANQLNNILNIKDEAQIRGEWYRFIGKKE